MPYNSLLYEVKEGDVALVTLNRPHRLNALSDELRGELIDVCNQIEKSGEIRAMVLTGAPRPDGRPCFSAGADIKEMKESGKTIGENEITKALWAAGEQYDVWQYVFNRLYGLSIPTIAAIDGVCTAGGLELALCCDLRVAATTARVSDLHMKTLGILGGGGLQTHLPHAVGKMKAKEIAWLNEEMDGQEALRIGLVCRVFPPEELISQALNLAHKLASHPPLAMKLSKMVMNATLTQGTYESLRFSALCESVLRYIRAKDFFSAVEAFTKR